MLSKDTDYGNVMSFFSFHFQYMELFSENYQTETLEAYVELARRKNGVVFNKPK
jgi:hypothetical protein